MMDWETGQQISLLPNTHISPHFAFRSTRRLSYAKGKQNFMGNNKWVSKRIDLSQKMRKWGGKSLKIR